MIVKIFGIIILYNYYSKLKLQYLYSGKIVVETLKV